MLIPEKYERDFLIYGFRCCLGRQTYVTNVCQETIKEAWPQLSKHDRQLFHREIREAAEHYMLGDPKIDAPGWLNILKLPEEE